MIITKERIAFAYVGGETEIDHIPLHEVVYVREMTEASSEECDKDEHKTFSNVMQIATRDDGYKL